MKDKKRAWTDFSVTWISTKNDVKKQQQQKNINTADLYY